MAEVIGKATLEVGADVSSLEQGFAKAGESVKTLEKTAATSSKGTSASFKTLGDAAVDASQRMDAQTRRFLNSLERQADRAGKTASEYAAFRAQQLGVADSAAPLVDKLRTVEQQFAKTGVSAAQTANAMRMVPAQMTDIVTQLAGGQNPLLVLTQQGGQLKDSFGGIGPALRGFGTYVAGLVNPLTVGAAAAALFGAAMFKGSQESTEFQKSLILTGGYAGKTSAQLSAMAADISRSIGTQSQASEVLNKLAGTGKIAGDQLDGVARAAISMNKATGEAVDETIKKFISLGDEPTKASAKLNETYHYLTDAVYEQIRALEEQGKKDEAAALAQKTLSDALQARAREVQQNLGFMERGWISLAGAAKSAWDYMLGLGRPDTLAQVKEKIAAARAEIEGMGDAKPGFNSTEGGAAIGNGNKRIAAAQARLRALQAQEAAMEADSTKAAADAETKRQDGEKIAARERLAAQAKATRSRADQRKDEIEQLKRDAQLVGLSADEYNKRAAAIEDKYKDPKGPKPKAYQDDAATKFIQQLKDQDAATRLALESSDKLTGAEKKRAEFLQQIADLKEKSILTADQKSLLANQDAIKAQLDQNVANERALKLKEDGIKLDERSAQLNAQISNYQQSQREQYGRQLDALGMGSEAQRNAEAVKSIYREYERRQADLDTATPKSQIGSQKYLDEQQKIRGGLQQSLKDYDDYYSQLKEKQADWSTGARTAFADYQTGVANVAAQAQSAFGSAFKGMEDALVNFAMTGKLSFGDFAKSVIADLIRIQTRAALSGIFSQLGNLVMGSIGGVGTDTGTPGVSSTTPVDMSNPVGLPMRADGGPVSAGNAYIVGERGPEIFKPNASGSIVPNHKLSDIGGSNSPTVNITQHNYVDSRSDQASIMQMMVQAKNAAVAEVKANLARGGDMRQLAGR